MTGRRPPTTIMKTFFQSVLKHIDRLDAAKLREQYRLVTEEVAFFEMVFNAMNEGAVLYDLKGNAVYRNPAAEALPDRDAPILVYCRSGRRSRRAAKLLDGCGYTQLYNLGSLIGWPYGLE